MELGRPVLCSLSLLPETDVSLSLGIFSISARFTLHSTKLDTGGHSWTSSAAEQGDDPSSEWLYKLVDPIKNTAIEVHEYLDVDWSGGHDYCYNPGPEDLAPLTAWLKKYGLKAIVAEFGSGQNQRCYGFIADMLNYLAANDEYIVSLNHLLLFWNDLMHDSHCAGVDGVGCRTSLGNIPFLLW
jgi:hypothetical protein